MTHLITLSSLESEIIDDNFRLFCFDAVQGNFRCHENILCYHFSDELCLPLEYDLIKSTLYTATVRWKMAKLTINQLKLILSCVRLLHGTYISLNGLTYSDLRIHFRFSSAFSSFVRVIEYLTFQFSDSACAANAISLNKYLRIAYYDQMQSTSTSKWVCEFQWLRREMEDAASHFKLMHIHCDRSTFGFETAFSFNI